MMSPGTERRVGKAVPPAQRPRNQPVPDAKRPAGVGSLFLSAVLGLCTILGLVVPLLVPTFDTLIERGLVPLSTMLGGATIALWRVVRDRTAIVLRVRYLIGLVASALACAVAAGSLVAVWREQAVPDVGASLRITYPEPGASVGACTTVHVAGEIRSGYAPWVIVERVDSNRYWITSAAMGGGADGARTASRVGVGGAQSSGSYLLYVVLLEEDWSRYLQESGANGVLNATELPPHAAMSDSVAVRRVVDTKDASCLPDGES